MVAGDGARAWDRSAAGMAGGDQAGRLGIAHQRHVIVGRLHRAEAGLGKAHAVDREFDEVGGFEARFEDHRTGKHAHAAWPVGSEAALRRQRQRLHALRIARPSRYVHLRCRNHRRGAAMDIAFQKPDGALARRIIAEGDVDVRVDEAGDRRHAAGIDHHVGALDRCGGRRADMGNALAVGDDDVAHCNWRAPIARDDHSEIDYRDLHPALRHNSVSSA